MKPFSSLIGISLLIFIGWIAVGGKPEARIERFCKPVHWSGNVTTSLFELGAPSITPYISRGFTSMEYGCRYTTWRVLYEKEWVAEQQEQQARLQEEMARQQLAAQEQTAASKSAEGKSTHKEGAR